MALALVGGSLHAKVRALGAGVGVGLAALGVSLLSIAVLFGAIDALAVDIPFLVLMLVALACNQYLALAGVALVYLRLRGLSLGVVGIRSPTTLEAWIVVTGWLTAMSSVIVAGIVAQLIGARPAPNEAAVLGADVPALLLVLIPAAFLIIGPCEELLFRGVIQRRFRDAFSAPTAIVLAAALFAGLHYLALIGPTTARLSTILLLVFPSLVFGAAYEYTENLVVPALIHGAYDATLFALLYVIVQLRAG